MISVLSKSVYSNFACTLLIIIYTHIHVYCIISPSVSSREHIMRKTDKATFLSAMLVGVYLLIVFKLD